MLKRPFLFLFPLPSLPSSPGCRIPARLFAGKSKPGDPREAPRAQSREPEPEKQEEIRPVVKKPAEKPCWRACSKAQRARPGADPKLLPFELKFW